MKRILKLATIFNILAVMTLGALVMAKGETPMTAGQKPAQQGELHLNKKAERTGDPLSGSIFGVFRASDGEKLEEITTGADGEAITLLDAGEYYLKESQAPYGYILEPAEIYFTVTAGKAVDVEVTNQRDDNIPDSAAPGGIINVPKTGQDFPVVNYLLGFLLLAVALLCAIWLVRKRKIWFT